MVITVPRNRRQRLGEGCRVCDFFSFSLIGWWWSNRAVLQESCVQSEVTILHLGGGSSFVEELKDIVMHISLSRNQDPVSRLYHHLIVFALFLYSLSSLIRKCLNPSFGIQGRSRRLNEAYILQIRNGEHTADLYSRVATPESCSVLIQGTGQL